MISLIIYVLLAAIFIGYLFIKNNRRTWIRKKIPYLKPKHFLLGNTADVLLNNVPLFKYHGKIYNELSPHKYGGYFNFLTPVLVIRDPELIKNILTKDFSYFMNRGNAFTDENEPLSMHLFNLSGEKWRGLRKKITPVFSSGKIKTMFLLMKECSSQLLDVINANMENNEFDARDLMARFTTDVIGHCVFGIECNSLNDPNSIFRQMGRKVFNTDFKSRFIGFFATFAPKLRRLLGLKFFSKDLSDFFEALVTQTIKFREENNVQTNDFISLLMVLRNETKKFAIDENKFELTTELMVAQCFLFFVAGFETSSGTSSFALYELAKNPKIQSVLYKEIKNVSEKFDDKITYECLQEMTYLSQIVDETLRIYPILPMIVRICNEKYQLDDDFIIEPGTRVIIPVLGLQLDPNYFEEPNNFNPDRFSKEKKNEIRNFTYLPFGEGPRMCLGMRFGLTQVKLALLVLIKNYEVSLSSKMGDDLEFTKTTFLASVDGGIWLNFKKRKN